MCGIAGLVSPGQIPDLSTLERMIDALKHRGPDEQHAVQASSVGLGQSRLSIIDLSPAASQPMFYGDSEWMLVYNGEIYNHLDLRSQLPPYTYAGHSDTETLLHLIATQGIMALDRCNGMFALAAVDLRRRRLYLARDRFGVKPLYIARHNGTLWFSSEIRAILATGFPRRVRQEVLRHTLIHYWTNGRDTLIDGIERVLPGTILEIDLDTLAAREVEWFHPASMVDPAYAELLARLSRAELVELVEERLRAAVTRRLLADVPIRTLCSGGLDSSLVTAYVRDAGADLVAYNVAVPDQPEADESPWAELVCKALDVPLHTAPITPDTWRAHFVRAVQHFEYPLVHESSIALAMLAAHARAEGVKILLTGEASDELFGGYGSRHLPERAWFAAAQSAGDDLQRPLDFHAPKRQDSLIALLDGPPLPNVVEYETQARSRFLEAYAHHPEPRRALEAAIGSDLRNFLSHGLNRKDKNLMQHSIEARVPFLDPDVIRLALNLSLELRTQPALKGVLNDVGRARLPEAIVTRPKVGFSFDVQPYLSAARDECLLKGRLRDTLGIDQERWQHALQSTNVRTRFRLWSAEVWCRLVLDGADAESVEAEIWQT